MSTIVDAVYENGVFRPTQPVDLPEHCKVKIELLSVRTPAESSDFDEVYSILGERYNSGEHDVAERHNEHQP